MTTLKGERPPFPAESRADGEYRDHRSFYREAGSGPGIREFLAFVRPESEWPAAVNAPRNGRHMGGGNALRLHGHICVVPVCLTDRPYLSSR